jgi:hypothetical protein
MIPEPQRTYVLELLAALGSAADDFVVAGAHAIKFAVAKARGTKDVDFILNVIALRKEPLQLAKVFESLGYTPVPESRNFQLIPLNRPGVAKRTSAAPNSRKNPIQSSEINLTNEPEFAADSKWSVTSMLLDQRTAEFTSAPLQT